MAEPLVQVRGVTKRYYGRLALDAVSFDIAEGEVFGYIGPNGAGKTTTLKILAGLITKFDGEMRVAGQDVRADRARAHALIGFLPQAAGFQVNRTVVSVLDSLGALSGVPAAVRRRRIPALLERFGLAAEGDRKIKELSGGMTQKLGLIQALLHEPRLLVLDEPLEGLDPPSRNLLKDIIRERQRSGTTVVFSSHILSDVEDVADRVGIVNGGRLATTGSVRDLVIGFGLPLEVEVELSTVPPDTAFLADPALGTAVERKPGLWRLRVPDGADVDALVHAIVERTLARGGRLRKIAVVEPDLDDLFAAYILSGHAR